MVNATQGNKKEPREKFDLPCDKIMSNSSDARSIKQDRKKTMRKLGWDDSYVCLQVQFKAKLITLTLTFCGAATVLRKTLSPTASLLDPFEQE